MDRRHGFSSLELRSKHGPECAFGYRCSGQFQHEHWILEYYRSTSTRMLRLVEDKVYWHRFIRVLLYPRAPTSLKPQLSALHFELRIHLKFSTRVTALSRLFQYVAGCFAGSIVCIIDSQIRLSPETQGEFEFLPGCISAL